MTGVGYHSTTPLDPLEPFGIWKALTAVQRLRSVTFKPLSHGFSDIPDSGLLLRNGYGY